MRAKEKTEARQKPKRMGEEQSHSLSKEHRNKHSEMMRFRFEDFDRLVVHPNRDTQEKELKVVICWRDNRVITQREQLSPKNSDSICRNKRQQKNLRINNII